MEQTIIAALITGFVAFFSGWLLRSTQVKPSYSRDEVNDRRIAEKAAYDNLAGRLLQAEALTASHAVQLATLTERLNGIDGKMDTLLSLMTKRKG